MVFIFECGCRVEAENTSKLKKGVPGIHGHKGAICHIHGRKLKSKIIICKMCKNETMVSSNAKRQAFCDECMMLRNPMKARQNKKNRKNKNVAILCDKMCTACGRLPIAKGNRFLCSRCFRGNSEYV